MSSTHDPTENAPISTSPPATDHDLDIDEPEADDGTSSQVSCGGNLRDDLERVLQADFNFTGSFAVSHTFPSTPLPGLHIQGIGVIGFPLSDRDAKLIEAAATQAPFGKGTETVVDTTVRDTFEINPDKFSFKNPAWPDFLHTVVKQVADGLGLPSKSPLPRAKLYKLLLYKTGSHFLPHKDTEKAPGMFASLIIVLPSKFEGGQVHVSHGNHKDVFDISPSSEFTTSALAWYTDVTHQVKPITSGYRLAVSYNLVNRVPGIPPPHLPDVHSAASQVEAIFRKWRKGGYEDPDFIAYLLNHEYSSASFELATLKGRDATLVSNIRQAAENQGVSLLLGLLDCEIIGDAGMDYGNSWGPAPGMEIVNDTEYKIEGLYDLDGDIVGDGNTVTVDPESDIIPQDPFTNEEPDDVDFEGFTGNEGAPLTYWYHRSVLVMSLVEEKTGIPLSIAGPDYVLKKLGEWQSEGPTERNKAMARFLINHLSFPDRSSTLMDLALKWEDLAIWQQVLEKTLSTGHAPRPSLDMLIRACGIFTFDRLKDILGITLRDQLDTTVAIGLIDDLQTRVASQDQDAKTWLKQQITVVLSKIRSRPTVADVQIYVGVARSEGLPFFSKTVVNQLVGFGPNFNFWVGLAEGLWKDKDKLLPSRGTPDEPSTYTNALNHTLDTLIIAAIPDCGSPPINSVPRLYHTLAHLTLPGHEHSCIPRLLDLMVLTQRTQHSGPLITFASQPRGDLVVDYQNSIKSLIPKLKDRYRQYGSSYFPVLDGFMRAFIERWLQDFLVDPSKQPVVKKVNCLCGDCAKLNHFLKSPVATETFWAAQKRRSHMEASLGPLYRSDVTYTTITGRSPHGLQVTKTPSLLATASWNARLQNTRALLALVGTRDVLARIMGERYQDVEAALAGTRPYKIRNSVPVAVPAASTSVTQATTSGTQTGPAVAGVKRKAEDDGDVIDLTSD